MNFAWSPPLVTGYDSEKLAIAASAVCGLAVAALFGFIISYLSRPRQGKDVLDVFEHMRRIRLRETSRLYRWFEPAIDGLAQEIGAGKPDALVRLRRDMTLSGNSLPWKAEEFLAGKYIEGVLVVVTLFATILGLTTSPLFAAVFAAVVGIAYVPMIKRQIHRRARLRLETIRRRLPYVMDLTSLTMEAGATFLESVQIVVQENRGHPLAEQLAEVLRDISVGRTRREALEALQQRLADEDVSEIVFAIIKGEELGTPLGQILRNQAEQMRLKRSQWAEKAAAEAHVNIVFPGLIVMMACLLIVVAPFVLGAIFNPGG